MQPGITYIGREGSSSDEVDDIKKMIKKRIAPENHIILCVVPANVDVATQEAIRLAKVQTCAPHPDQLFSVP